jgi:hypothetical protein
MRTRISIGVIATVVMFASNAHSVDYISNQNLGAIYGPTMDAGVYCGVLGVCATTSTVDYNNAYVNSLNQYYPLPPGTVLNGKLTTGSLFTNSLVRVGDLIAGAPAVVALQQRLDASFQQLQQLQNTTAQIQQSVQQAQQSIQQAVIQADRGIAAVAAMANVSMPSAPGRTMWAVNGAAFQSEIGGGISFAHRLNTSMPIAITAAYGNGGGSAHVGRVGLMGEF